MVLKLVTEPVPPYDGFRSVSSQMVLKLDGDVKNIDTGFRSVSSQMVLKRLRKK